MLVWDWLSVIAQRAATACPPYNVAGFCRAFAAANANRLRIGPCEKKTKRREFARWREGVPPVLPAGRSHYHGVSIAYLSNPATPRRSSQKDCVSGRERSLIF